MRENNNNASLSIKGLIYNKEGDKSSGIKGIECYLPAYSKK